MLQNQAERLREAPYQLSLRATLAAAVAYRRRLESVSFVGVTGSAGKTTTKELIAAILGSEMVGTRTPGNNNLLATVAKTVLRTRSTDDFCVVEVAASLPGNVKHAARVVQPGIAVVTNIGFDHRAAFATLDAIAHEKRDLLSALPEAGTAVLNADDPRVIAMADGIRARRLTFGRSPDAMLRAETIRASWPDRLSFTLRFGRRSWSVATRLCGEHLVSSVLAALAVAVAMDMPLERAIDAAATLEPYPGRMSPVQHDGVTFIRDDYKAPLWSLDAPLAFLADAQAGRKLAVIGTISNYAGASSAVYGSVASRALAVADEVLFVGPGASHLEAVPGALGTGSIRALRSVREAAEYLRATLRAGDLVLLKGSNRTDHLLRAVLFQTGELQCWRVDCRRTEFCDGCSLLHVPAA